MHILVVDDDPTWLALCEIYLRNDGHVIHAVKSGAAAIEAFGDHVHLVISDFFMPGMTGGELFGELRARRADVPFIFLTASDDLNIAVDLVRRGASDFIQKPVDAGVLQLRIERVMADMARRREIEAIRREQELVRRENQRLVTWRMLYSSKDTRQTQQLIDNLSRNINSTGGFDWVDLLEEMKEEHDEEFYRIPRAVVDLAVSSARGHQELLHRITEIGMLSTTELDLTDSTVESAVRALVAVTHERHRGLVEEQGRRLLIPETTAAGFRRHGMIRWNMEILQSLVSELIINAVKYSPEDSPITVEFSTVDAAPHPHFSIQVRNHAKAAATPGQDGEPIVGVPEEYSELVFELFYTIDSFPTTLEGEQWKDGTGLYFVRSLARAMGGWADIRSGVDYVDGTAHPQVICELRLPLV